VRIWDPATGQQRAVLKGQHTFGVAVLAVAPDGSWLATIGGREDGSVRIWDPVTGHARAVMRVNSRLSACAWDHSGHWLAVAGQDGLYLFTFHPGI
jgi:WD40 repeat protein